MKKKRPSEKAKSARGARPAGSRTRALVLVDAGPIRARALRLYRQLEDRIAKVRRALEEYEGGDLPAYRRWEAVELGPLLSELRALTEELEQKRDLLDAIADEQAWSGCSAVAAYRRVMRELERADDDGDAAFEDSSPEQEADGPKLFGDSDLPDGIDAAAYDRMPPKEKAAFREFYKQMAELFESLTGEPAPDLDAVLKASRAQSQGADQEPRGSSGRGHEAPSARTPPKTQDRRLKELYRKLVRELHPDVKGEQTAREREFWHQVQDAYQAGDLARLEALAGRVDMGLVGNADHLPVQVVLRMAQELAEALEAMVRQLGAAKDHPAWNFRKKGAALGAFAAKRRRELSVGLRAMRTEVGFLRQHLEHLAEKAAKPAKKRKKKAGAVGSRAAAFMPKQADFGF